jgi:hypothetical protein
LKKIWISVSIIATLLIGAFLYLKIRKSKDFEPLIKAKLQQLVKDGSDSLYVLEMDKIEVDVLNSKAVVHNAQLLIDSARLKVLTAEGKAPVDVYKISLSDLNIDGLNIDDFLSKKDIDLDILTIKNPVFEIYHPVGKDTAISTDTATLYSRIQQSLGHFHLKNLAILNMNFKYHNIEHKEKSTEFNNVSLKFRDIEIDSLTQYDTTRFLYAKDALIYLYDYSFHTPDSLYIAKADSLTLHAAQRMLDVKGLYLKPRGNKQEFSKKLKYYKDRYDIKFKSASFKDIDWYHLFLGESFTAKKAEFNNGEMEVYANMNIPLSGKSKVGNYPHQLLMKLDFPTDVDTILVKNFKVTYTELNPKSEKTGDIVFDDIDATITNVTNIPEKISINKTVKLSATSKLMSKGNFDAVFTFDLTKTKSGDFTVDANLGPMDGIYLNDAARPLGLFEINSVSIKKLKTHIEGNNYSARGSVYFVYDNLKITALKPDDSNKLKSRGFISFIANTFIINKSNSKADAKQEYSSFKRDPARSFFYLIWKTLLTGITQTVS